MKYIVKKENATPKQFLGVDFVVLSIGNDSMVTKMLYKETDFVLFHKHPNEQSGYVISGKYKLKFGGEEFSLSQGDTYSIPANLNIHLKSLNRGRLLMCLLQSDRIICKL